MWLQGIHCRVWGTSSAGSELRMPSVAAIWAENMPWVWITPFGVPVEPEVKRILETVSGVSRSRARSTSARGAVPVKSESGVVPSPPSTVTKVSDGSSALSVAKALANAPESWANTTLGRTTPMQCFSLAWSVATRL
jgi:hypothetical protein